MQDPRDPVPNAAHRYRQQLKMEVSALRDEPSIKKVLTLVNLFLEDTREDNDHAGFRTVLRNQGKIEGYQALIEIITRDYPDMETL